MPCWWSPTLDILHSFCLVLRVFDICSGQSVADSEELESTVDQGLPSDTGDGGAVILTSPLVEVSFVDAWQISHAFSQFSLVRFGDVEVDCLISVSCGTCGP